MDKSNTGMDRFEQMHRHDAMCRQDETAKQGGLFNRRALAFGAFPRRQHQKGASMMEFLIVAPALMFLGLGTVQAGLIYHGKTILNYATFEAARTGATRNAQLDPMRRELGTRLAPLHGGDGEQSKAILAIAKSRVVVNDPMSTRIDIISPSLQSFEAWGVTNADNRRVIPNSHLRHQTHAVNDEAGVSLQDANLLKIKVTHGLDLKIPFVSSVLLTAMATLDPDNLAYYSRGKFPLTSTATVRMQSEAWEDSVVAANAAIAATEEPLHPNTLADETNVAPVESEQCVGDHGLGGDSEILPTSAVSEGECGASSTQFNSNQGNPFESEEEVYETSPIVADSGC